MTKCSSCHGTLRNGETSCFICGVAVPPERAKTSLMDRFRVAIKVAFIFSGLLTIASLFTDLTPSFVKCLLATVILMLVKSSADQMAESQ